MSRNITKKINILVVDDDAPIRDLFSRALNSKRCDVRVALNGEEAIKIAKKHPIHLSFIDMRMPGMDGLDTFRAMKTINPDMVVVIISGFSDTTKINAAIQDGATSFLKKPFNISDIKSFVEKNIAATKIGGVNVLVVDDDLAICKLFKRMERLFGYSVETVSDVKKALKLLEKRSFDIAFIDMVLPKISGTVLCDKINKSHPNMKVVLFTGHAKKNIDMLLRTNKKNIFAIAKPFNISLIKDIVQGIERPSK